MEAKSNKFMCIVCESDKKQIKTFSSRCSLCRTEIEKIIGPKNENIEVNMLEFQFDPS